MNKNKSKNSVAGVKIDPRQSFAQGGRRAMLFNIGIKPPLHNCANPCCRRAM